MDEIKNKINEIKDANDLTMKGKIEKIFEEIRGLSIDEQLEACDLYVKKVKEIFKNERFNRDELIGWISGIRADLALSGLSAENIDDIITQNELDADKILGNEPEQIQSEIEQINEEISRRIGDNGVEFSNLDNPEPSQSEEEQEIQKINSRIAGFENGKFDTIEAIDQEIQRLETEKSNQMKEINEQIDIIDKEIEKNEITAEKLEAALNTIEEEIEALSSKAVHYGTSLTEEEFEALSSKEVHSRTSLTEEENKILEQKNKRAEEIEIQLAKIQKYANNTDEELEAELNRLLTEQMQPEQESSELDIQIQAVENEIEKIELQSKTDEDLNNDLTELEEEMQLFVIGRISTETEEVKALETKIANIKTEKERRASDKFFNKTTEQLTIELETLKSELSFERSNMNNGDVESVENVNKLNIKIEEIEKELKNRNHNFDKKEQLEQMLKNLKEQKNAQKESNSSKNTENIEEIKSELNRRKQVKENAEKQHKKDELIEKKEQIQSEFEQKIQDFKELRDLVEIRDAYTQIQNDVINALDGHELSEEELKIKVDEFVETHKKAPVLNNYKNVNKLKNELKESIYNRLKKEKKIEKKEQNTKLLYKGLAGVAGFVAGLALAEVPGVGAIRMGLAVTKMAYSAINTYTMKKTGETLGGKIAKVIGIDEKWKEKHPRIMSRVNKIRATLNNPYMKWFTNGVAAGYVTGNLYEMFTSLESASTTVEVESTPLLASTENLQQGDVLDLSGIERGYVGPDTASKSLMQYAGKEAVFDKTYISPKTGETWYHFKQGANAMEGAGYAWFTEDQIKAVLENAEQIGKSVSRN